MKRFLLLSLALCLTASLSAQKPIRNCVLPSDSGKTYRVTIDQAKTWADQTPLKVLCEGTPYFLEQFQISMTTMNPLQTKEFGIGNQALPLMARRELDKLQPKDGVLLKEVSAKDEKGNLVKLPNVVFSIKD